MNINKLQSAVNRLKSDLNKVEGCQQAEADVLILFAQELDQSLIDIVKQIEGDEALFENCNTFTMEAALHAIVSEPEDHSDSWRLVDEGIELYARN